MTKKIIKRDGQEDGFDIDKIVDAIDKAMRASGIEDDQRAETFAHQVQKFLSNQKNTKPTVEQIQDVVESVLIAGNLPNVAKNYILYRAERTRIRELGSRVMRNIYDLTFKSAKENDTKRENANIDGDTAMGTMLKYGSETAKAFYEMSILNPKHSEMHNSGDIHIHDLDFLMLTTTCCQIDLQKLFQGGFCTGHGFLREPNSIAAYSSLACIAIQSNQNDQHGGQSVPNFDYALSAGVAKSYIKNYRDNLSKAIQLLCGIDNLATVETLFTQLQNQNLTPSLTNNATYIQKELEHLSATIDKDTANKCQQFALQKAEQETDKQTYQAMEALIHNLNTMHSRAGAQIPFSSINYGTDTTAEGRMVVKNVLLATIAGLGSGETPIFPIQIFKVKAGVNYNPQDPNYDLLQLAMQCSAKRLFPNFSFLDASFNQQYYQAGHPETEIAYMGCRTRVISNEYDKSKQVVNGRGNLSFTSINLPRIAIESKQDQNKFFSILDSHLQIVTDQLLERFEIQARKKVKNFPFLMGQGIWIDSDKLQAEDEIREVIKNGSLTAGFIGLAECLQSLIGQHHGESEEAQKLGLKIVSFMRQRMDEASKKYHLNFGLIATPAEGLSGRFVRLDKKKYGILPNITDREYYTNSFHIPVHYSIPVHKKIQLEAPYHALTNGGHISYVELDGDTVKNPQAFETIIRYMYDQQIGYGSINHPVDRDPICGYTGIINETCPKCGRTEKESSTPFVRIRRITGYLVGSTDRFNNAKQAEERERVKHNL